MRLRDLLNCAGQAPAVESGMGWQVKCFAQLKVDLRAGMHARAVAAGDNHWRAMYDSGAGEVSVRCVGRGSDGQLAQDNVQDRGTEKTLQCFGSELLGRVLPLIPLSFVWSMDMIVAYLWLHCSAPSVRGVMCVGEVELTCL